MRPVEPSSRAMRAFGVLAAFVLLLAAPAGAAERVVAVGSDVTEIILSLGAADALVAVDDSSAVLPEAAALPRVGYMRALSAEGTIAQRPSVVLAATGAGPDAVLSQLRVAGVRVVNLPEERTAVGLADKIRSIARTVGREPAGEALATEVLNRLAAVERRVAAEPSGASAIVILAAAPGRVLAGGTDTAADAVLRLAGARNAFGAVSGYKPLTPEAAVAADPDLIVVPSHVLGLVGSREALLADPALAATRAGRAGRIAVIDTNRLLTFGPHLPEAVEELHAALREARR